MSSLKGVALQLWSVGEDMAKDFAGTLKKLAEAGFTGVEFAGYHGLTAEQVTKALSDAGLQAAGSHISLEAIEKDLDNVIAFEKAIGNENIVCPYASVKTEEELNHLIEVMTIAGKKLSQNGMHLFYHNHDNEFIQFNGEYALDTLFAKVPSEYLETEIDTFWVKKAGLNEVDYVKKYNGRTALIHIKDMNSAMDASTEVGHGIMDIAALVKECINSNTQWLVIEQEEFTKLAPLDAVTVGAKNLIEIVNEN